MYCEKCGAKLPDDARFCKDCGVEIQAEIEPTVKKKNKIVIPIVVSVLLISLIVSFVVVRSNQNNNVAKNSQEESIDDYTTEETGEVKDADDSEKDFASKESEDNNKKVDKKKQSNEPESVWEGEIERIRDICWDIDAELSNMKKEDGGGDTTRYIDSNGKIRMIIAEPGAYYDTEHNDLKAYYFYDLVDTDFVEDYEMPCYVSVELKNGNLVKFYLIEGDESAYECIRYVDGDGNITDYKDPVSPSEINSYGVFCDKAYIEIVWAYGG